MSSSKGSFHVDQDRFANVIGALALARANDRWMTGADPNVEPHNDLVRWVRAFEAQRGPLVMRLALTSATTSNQAGSISATQAISPGLEQIRIDDPEWFAREMAFWDGPDCGALVASLREDADAALERMLPSELGADEALTWAKNLAASLR